MSESCQTRATSENGDTGARGVNNSTFKLVMVENKKRVSTIGGNEGTIGVEIGENIARKGLWATEANRAGW